ncbi:LysM peptidoglycan-binding domain-containing protein [Apibacter muscae]|uniref:LysM peptidoglycan-binding domain-containing protein n=1 Tax=Apibacter muscae TaxID=2509004 RepID=A0A563D8H5_9FLAO|nr:LysM peptidoglycan-binding domain-containing protein [Apibacter muscae]TWP26546.1 LysM peptidoglycan-binding domain-containing protein [Apibacter muscae]
MKKFFILLSLLLMNAFILGQKKQHIVEAKETLYGISKKYNVTIDDLKRENPKLIDRTPQIGEKLTIPENKVSNNNSNSANVNLDKNPSNRISEIDSSKENISNNENISKDEIINNIVRHNLNEPNYIYITIEPKETLYSLSKKYKVSIETIQKLNPSMDIHGPKIGEVLKLPNKNSKLKESKVIKSDSILNESNRTSIPSDYYSKDAINVVMILPFQSKSNKEKEIALDFYSGAKLALDSLTNNGKRFNLNLIDNSDGTNFVDMINSYDFSSTNLIIGPLFKTDLINVAKINKNIPIISPFTSSYELDDYSNIIMYNTKEQTLIEKLADELLKKYDGEKTFILYDQNNYQNALYLQSLILNRKNNAEVILTQNAQDINTEQNLVTDETEDIYAILISDKENLTQQYLDQLLELNQNNVFPISLNYSYLFDLPKYSNQLLQMGLLYSDTNYVNENGFNEEKTLNSYKKKFCESLNKYSVSGFDVTYDILNRIDSKGNLADHSMKIERKQLSNKYYFNRVKKSGAWTNQGVRIIKLM